MKEFKKRLFENWKTTLLGLTILSVAIVTLITGKITGSEFALLLPTILLLFRVKDTVLGNKLGSKTQKQ